MYYYQYIYYNDSIISYGTSIKWYWEGLGLEKRKCTINYKIWIEFPEKVGSHVHNVSEFKNETQTIHQQIYIL